MELITADEVATILKVPTARVYELARSGTLPSVHLGARQIRFDEEALRAWIDSGGSARPKGNGDERRDGR
jgi:excisionase family DNA binding protein